MRRKRFSSLVVCFVWSSICWICKQQSTVYSFQTNTRISNNRKNTKQLFATTTAISSSISGSRRRDSWGLSNKQKEALELIQDGKNVFITGVAGTGKSLLLNRALEYLDNAYNQRQYVALGPTGPAAIALEGQTIHSFAGIGIPRTIDDFMKCKTKKKQWRNLKVLVLDEASMVSGEFFDLMSDAVSEIRKDPRPFGGIQLVVCGDFLQLSPIAPRKPDMEQMVAALQAKEGLDEQTARELLFLNRGFCFQALNWKRANFQVVELDQVFRQQNNEFVDILQDIRTGRVAQQTLDFLRTKCERPLPPNEFGIRPTILHSRNRDVTRDNLAELRQLPGDLQIYESIDKVARERGAPKWAENQLKQSQFFTNCIAEKELQLKVGAQVMLVKNEGLGPNQLVNGSRGTVVGFRAPPPSQSAADDVMLLDGVEKYPVVQFVNGAKKIILPKSFESRLVGIGTCTRLAIPLKLAWAITTHKAQGLTLDYVIADLGQVFAEAQAYVALSRASDENGLELRNFSPTRVRANRMALAFYENPDQDFPYWNGKMRPPPAVSNTLASSPVPPHPAMSNTAMVEDDDLEDATSTVNVAVSVRKDFSRNKVVITQQQSQAPRPRPISPPPSSPRPNLDGKIFVFSGVLRFSTRDQAERMIQKRGGIVRKAVSGKTNFLVVGRKLRNGKPITSGAEYKKAIDNGQIKIITEEDFLQWVQ